MLELSPVIVVFLGLGTAYALLFHLWRGRSLQHLLLFWLTSVFGFSLGSLAGTMIPLHIAMLGGIPVLAASVGALLLLLVVALRIAV